MPTNEWHNFGNNFPAPATVTSPLAFREIEKIWFALRQRGRIFDVDASGPWAQWPPTGEKWFNGTYDAYLVDGAGLPVQVTCLDSDGHAPSWAADYWDSTLDVEGRPNQFDLIFDSDAPEGCYRCQVDNVVSPPSNTLTLAPSGGQPAPRPELWNGRVTIIRRNARWWSDAWPKFPTADDPKGGTLLWYSGLWGGGQQFYSVDAKDGVAPAGGPTLTVDYSAPTGPGGLCEGNTAAVFDVDFYTGKGSDNPCQPDRYLNPDVLKSFRGAQVAARGFIARYVRDLGPHGYDGWDKYNISDMYLAEGFYAAGINAWTGTTGTPDGLGKLPVPGYAGVTIPADWGTITPANPRTVFYQIVSEGWPSPYNRAASGMVISAGTANYDGSHLYGPSDGSNFEEEIFFNGVAYKRFANCTVYLSFGETRTVKRQFRYLYPREVWVPDLDDDGNAVDPPTEEKPGAWVVRPASTAFVRFTPYGIVSDDPDTDWSEDTGLYVGVRARYRGDNFMDPCLRQWPADATVAYSADDPAPDPRIPYWARFATFWRTAPARYTPQAGPSVVAGGTVHSVSAGGFVDKDQNWDTAYERQVWKERELVLIDPAGTRHAGLVIAGSVNQDVTVDGVTTTGTAFTYSGAASPEAGWTYEVREWQPGAVLEWDGDRWAKPTTLRAGETRLPPDVQCIEPDQTTRFGLVENEDVFPGEVLAQLRKMIDAQIVTKESVGWTAAPVDPVPETALNRGYAIATAGDTWDDIVTNIANGWAHLFDTEPYFGSANIEHTQSGLAPRVQFDNESSLAERVFSYGKVDGMETIFAKRLEFLAFADLASGFTSKDVYEWQPPQVDADGNPTTEPGDPDNPANWTDEGFNGSAEVYHREGFKFTFDAEGDDVLYRAWSEFSDVTTSAAKAFSGVALGDTALTEPIAPEAPIVDHSRDGTPAFSPPLPPGTNASWAQSQHAARGYFVTNAVVLIRHQFTYVPEGFAG